jgi:hypothetical protein
MGSRTPPLRLKVERRGGSEMVFIAVDPGALIWNRRRGAPPISDPPPYLKIGRQGGSEICCAPSIWARKSGPPGLACCLPRAHYRPKLWTSGFYPFFCVLPPPMQELSLTVGLEFSIALEHLVLGFCCTNPCEKLSGEISTHLVPQLGLEDERLLHTILVSVHLHLAL